MITNFIYLYIYIYIYIKLRGRPLVWRQWACTSSCTRYVSMFLCRKSLVAPFVVFLRFVLCFRGARRSAMMLSCVFATSRTICAFFFSVEFLLGTFWWFFCVFLCLGPICWPPGGLLCSFFASWIRKGTYLCQLAPPDHQLGGKWGHKVDFCPSPGVAFRTTFWYFFVFFGILRFCENWAPV